jgi:hypothetical protein
LHGAKESQTRQVSGEVGEQAAILSCKTEFDLIERDFWTKSSSLGKTKLAPNQTTSSGTSNAKSWSNTNKKVAIAWFQRVTNKTSLWGFGFATSGAHNKLRPDRKTLLLDEIGFSLKF